MQLHCLGTTGYHPSCSRHTACYAIPEAGLVFDAGTGMFRLASILQSRTIDLLLSHAHLDHVAGLTFLLDTKVVHELDEVRVWGEQEKLDAIQTHLFNELIFPVRPAFIRYCPLPKKQFTLASGARVQPIPLEHPGGAVGYRVDWPNGKSVAYITDTVGDANAAYTDLVQGVDVLLHECYFRDSQRALAKKTGHTWTTAAGQVARKVGARKTYFIHMNPLETSDDPIDIHAAQAICPSCEVARDEQVIDF